MNNIKINYRKIIDKNGNVYNQTITITKDICEEYNEFVKNLMIERYLKLTNKKAVTEQEKELLTCARILEKGLNLITMDDLDYFMKFYLWTTTLPKENKTFERILWRPTIIKVIN